MAELFPDTDERPSVLELGGNGHVATKEPVSDFPTAAFSATFWVRSLSTPAAGGSDEVVLSYALPDASPAEFDILLHDLRSLRLLVHGAYVSASERYDGPSGGDLSGITLGVDVARDKAWHHVAISWRSSDGRVEAFLDGARSFSGGPYKTGSRLSAGGSLVLGRARATACDASRAGLLEFDQASPLSSIGCAPSGGDGRLRGLAAQVQHLRLWSKFLSPGEVAEQMHQPFRGNSVGQVTSLPSCEESHWPTGLYPPSGSCARLQLSVLRHRTTKRHDPALLDD